MVDRPIKAGGKYNLNFIDWQNEHERIIGAEYDGETPPLQSPIVGITAEEFHRLMLEDSLKFRLEQESMDHQLQKMGVDLTAVRKMKVGKTNKQCTICIRQFLKGEVIRLLKCKHIFHDQCILPWLNKNAICPNCRTQVTQ